MTRTSPPQVAFSSGELDPLLHRRFDYQRFQTGLRKCRGFLPLPQGGFTRAPGTRHLGSTRANAAGILVPFQFARNDALVLEFTPLKMRVWRYGTLIMAGAAPYELTTPYDAAALASLQFVQSADVIYLADGLRPIHKLSRFALDNWTVEPALYDNGPFRVQNLKKARTVQASATTGTITLTASQALFVAGHVGSLLRLTPTDNTGIPLWTSNETLSVGDNRRYGDNVYQLTEGTNAGDNPPIHLEGVAMVDNGPTKWRFITDGVGIARITAVTSGTVATAEVIKTIPRACVDDPTYRWSEGAWSAVYGYPATLEIFDQRLVAAATPSEPRTLWFSVVGDFADFTEGVEADDAFAYSIAGDASVNRVLNLRRGRTGLHVYALGEEYATRSETRNQVIGPTTAVFDPIGSSGANAARPIAPDGDPIFISRDERRVLQQSYSIQSDSTRAANLSRPAQHIGAVGFKQIAWQATPEPTAWLRMGDGTLSAMVYDPSEEVLGWAVVPVAGGFVESLAIVPDDSGSRDLLTMIVRREIDGVVQRYVEEMSLPITADIAAADINHLYAAKRFDSATPLATVSVPHLAGEALHAWTNQGCLTDLQADGAGLVTLPEGILSGWIGLFDATHEVETLDIQAASPSGNSTGRGKRLKVAAITVHETVQGYVAARERGLQSDVLGRLAELLPWKIGRDPVLATTGVIRSSVVSGLAPEISLVIRPYSAAPLTITSIVPTVEETG